MTTTQQADEIAYKIAAKLHTPDSVQHIAARRVIATEIAELVKDRQRIDWLQESLGISTQDIDSAMEK